MCCRVLDPGLRSSGLSAGTVRRRAINELDEAHQQIKHIRQELANVTKLETARGPLRDLPAPVPVLKRATQLHAMLRAHPRPQHKAELTRAQSLRERCNELRDVENRLTVTEASVQRVEHEKQMMQIA